MKNQKSKVKSLIFTLVLVAVVLWMAPGAMAATVRNRNTGPGSINSATRTDLRTHSHAANKTGGVLNIDIGLANTGGNNADGNTVGPNEVDSGETTASVDSEDLVNLSTLQVNQSDSAEEDMVENDTTGPGSVNTAGIVRTRSVSFAENSTGGVLNFSLGILNSGGNSTSGNTTGANTVDTGDAEFTVSHASDVNGADIIVTQ